MQGAPSAQSGNEVHGASQGMEALRGARTPPVHGAAPGCRDGPRGAWSVPAAQGPPMHGVAVGGTEPRSGRRVSGLPAPLQCTGKPGVQGPFAPHKAWMVLGCNEGPWAARVGPADPLPSCFGLCCFSLEKGESYSSPPVSALNARLPAAAQCLAWRSRVHPEFGVTSCTSKLSPCTCLQGGLWWEFRLTPSPASFFESRVLCCCTLCPSTRERSNSP